MFTVVASTFMNSPIFYSMNNTSSGPELLHGVTASSRAAANTTDSDGGYHGNVTYEYYPNVKQTPLMIAVLSLLYGAVFVMAVFGNLVVLFMVLKDRRFHSPVYILIGNLAVADLIMAIVCLPITLLHNLFTGWQWGAFMCKAVPYSQGVSVCASVNTLVVIAVDRYLAICHPMRRRNTKHMARVILVIIWLVALTLMTPWAIVYRMDVYISPLQSLDVCLAEFPEPWQQRAFNLGVLFLVCYALPLAFIISCYVMIGYRVWHRDAPGITSNMGVIEKSKIRVLKMLIVVVVLFAASWMPLYVMQVILPFANGNNPDAITLLILPFAQWLGSSNCCMNPLVYCLFSQKIRRRIRALLCCTTPETRSVYSHRSTYINTQVPTSSTRDTALLNAVYNNGTHNCHGHRYGGGNLYHHRTSRHDGEFIRLSRTCNTRSTHV